MNIYCIEPQWKNISPQTKSKITAFTTTKLRKINQPIHELVDMNVFANPGESAVNIAYLSNKHKLNAVCYLQQQHENKVIYAQPIKKTSLRADACWTNQKKLACLIMTADCLPIFFCNSNATKVALIHAGWRGLYKGIIAQALKAFDENNETIFVAFGPAIRQNNYIVDSNFYQKFITLDPNNSECFYLHKNGTNYHADLWKIAHKQLSNLGVKNIGPVASCTYANPELFYSYRKTKTNARIASLIWLNV